MTNKITIRQFQREFYSHLDELPLVVTKNGKDFIVVIKCEDGFMLSKSVTTPQLEEKDKVVVKKRQPSPPRGSKIKLVPVGEICKHGIGYHEGCHYENY